MKKPAKRTIFDCAGIGLGDEADLFVPKGHVCTIRLPPGEFKLIKVAEKSKHRHPTLQTTALPRRRS